VLTEPGLGPPIGFLRDGDRYQSSVLDLAPGALLCFYTDGLVERRDSTIDAGLRKLRDSVSAASPEAVCARVMAALVGSEIVQDDIAVLTMRRDPA
jgi:sigma-B regulation protein RsbU (phosphoserine phosphatase)